jgi:hypothetical protein
LKTEKKKWEGNIKIETAFVEYQATDVEVLVRFLALPVFLSSGSGIGSSQPCEYNSGAVWKK